MSPVENQIRSAPRGSLFNTSNFRDQRPSELVEVLIDLMKEGIIRRDIVVRGIYHYDSIIDIPDELDGKPTVPADLEFFWERT